MIEYKGFKLPSSKYELELMYRSRPYKVRNDKVELEKYFIVSDGTTELRTDIIVSRLHQSIDEIQRTIRNNIDEYLFSHSDSQ